MCKLIKSRSAKIGLPPGALVHVGERKAEGTRITVIEYDEEQFMDVYPNFVNDAIGQFFTAYGKPKQELFKGMLGGLTDRRSLIKAAGDMISMARAVMGW